MIHFIFEGKLKMDNRHLAVKELLILKKKAVMAVVRKELSQKKACKVFGFSQTSMCKYMVEYRQYGEASFEYVKRGAKPRAYCKLTLEQEELMRKTLLMQTPDEVGMDYTLWNSKVITEFVRKEFGVTYAARSMRDVMKRMGFSCQKPIKRAYERDPAKVKIWLEIEYPRIKTQAMQEGARIYWADEMGIQSQDNRGKMYSLKGKKPIIKKSGTRFKCNVLAAITSHGHMNWTVYKDNFNGQKFIEFLKRILRQVNQKVFMIVDNHKAHHSKEVKTYVEKNKDRIALFYLPPYSPEINPQELVNQEVKAHANNFKVVRKLDDLMTNVRYYLTKLQCNPFKVINYFRKKEVVYAGFDDFNILTLA
jgi:transposase